MSFPAIFAIIVGLGMVGQWFASFLTGGIPELTSEPYRIAFHLAGEFVTALLLIVSGIGLLIAWPLAPVLFLVACGMLLYTAIVSPGYFVQQGQPGWLIIFCGLILAAITSIVIVVNSL